MITQKFKFIKYKISIKYTNLYSLYQTKPSYIIEISARDQIRNINGNFKFFNSLKNLILPYLHHSFNKR